MASNTSPQSGHSHFEADVAVIGGGLLGSAIAWGLARERQRVTILDEGDAAFRPSRGNAALVWVQGKGLGMPEYAAWTYRSSESWSRFAALLKEETGIDVGFQRPGGIDLCLSEAELAACADGLKRLHNQPHMVNYPHEILDRTAIEKMLPQIGPEVVGGSFCPLDGHCNVLRLLRALQASLARPGVTYLANHAVERIERQGGVFRLMTPHGICEAEKVVLAAGHANARLAPMVGLSVSVRPQRGQIIVTERVRPFLHYAMSGIGQTDDGSVLLGTSVEEAGWDDHVTTPVLAAIADRAVRKLPLLGALRVVRSWAALRVMTTDGFPIYDQSLSHPGAFSASCHSGVTLAANHALALAPMIAAGNLAADLHVFSARRFDVSQAIPA